MVDCLRFDYIYSLPLGTGVKFNEQARFWMRIDHVAAVGNPTAVGNSVARRSVRRQHIGQLVLARIIAPVIVVIQIHMVLRHFEADA